jgi:hypothetical protein
LEWFRKHLIALEAAAYLDKPGVVVERLKEIVPTFCPVSHTENAVALVGFDGVNEEVAR